MAFDQSSDKVPLETRHFRSVFNTDVAMLCVKMGKFYKAKKKRRNFQPQIVGNV